MSRHIHRWLAQPVALSPFSHLLNLYQDQEHGKNMNRPKVHRGKQMHNENQGLDSQHRGVPAPEGNERPDSSDH